MTVSKNPFTDENAIRGPLYDRSERIEARGEALIRAKVEGANVATTITELLGALPHRSTILDAGAGPGNLARYLGCAYPTSTLVAVDQSHALCQASQRRLTGHSHGAVQADFHKLPFMDDSFDVAVAAFSLYHSLDPATAIAELARVLTPNGQLIATTKSVDSYAQLDEIVAAAGLVLSETARPSLYEAFHSTNAANIISQVLNVQDVIHQEHVFRFDDFDHLATYLATTPKYRYPEPLGKPKELATKLRARLLERPLTMTSTVTYLVARPYKEPGGGDHNDTKHSR